MIARMVNVWRFAALASLIASTSTWGADPIRPQGVARHPRTTGKLLVQPRAGVDPAEFAAWAQQQSLETLRVQPGLGNLHLIRSHDAGEEEAIAKLQQSGLVEFAEPDYILSVSTLSNDPAVVDGTAWALSKISVPAAWSRVRFATNVVVAIIDSGIRTTHEELKDSLWVNPGEIDGNGVDDDGNGIVDDVHGLNAITDSGDISDDVGHGTHVAGIIGAAGNNGKGSSGVAWKVQLMPLKFIASNGDGATSDAIACIDYARTHGANIINASWGGADSSTALRNAISRARTAGIIFVSAAGNDGVNTDRRPTYPAAFNLDNIVSVAASDENDALASFSNYGAVSVDLLSPGVGIYSSWHTADDAYTTLSGTSMATPYVTGAFAILKARFPTKAYRDLITALVKSVDKVTAASGKTVSGGRLNLAAALNYLSPLATPAIVITETENTLNLQITGETNAQLQIEQSADLVSWTPSTSITLDASGQGRVTRAADPMQKLFFRAVQP